MQHHVKDLGLADKGKDRIEWAQQIDARSPAHSRAVLKGKTTQGTFAFLLAFT